MTAMWHKFEHCSKKIYRSDFNAVAYFENGGDHMRANIIFIVMALGLVACSPSDTKVQQGQSSSQVAAEPVIVPPMVPVDSHSASATSVLTEPLPSKAQLLAWRTQMDEACASAAPSLRIEHFDVDDDGTADTICWRIVKTKEFGELIDVQARVEHSGKTQKAYIIIPFGGGQQYGICGPSEAIVVEQRRWTRQDFEEMGWDYIGPIGISLNGGDCDPPWLFWSKNAQGEVWFEFARA